MTIRDIGNGWTDHSDEGPSNVLLYKGDYMVHQSSHRSTITVQLDDDDAEDFRKFKTVKAAKAWVDKQVAEPEEDITIIGDAIILRGKCGFYDKEHAMDKHIAKHIKSHRVVSHSITTDQFGSERTYTVIMGER